MPAALLLLAAFLKQSDYLSGLFSQWWISMLTYSAIPLALLGALTVPEVRSRLCSIIYRSARSLQITCMPGCISYLNIPDTAKLYSRLYLNPSQKYFTLRAILRVAWPQIAAIMIVKLMINLLEYIHKLTFVYLLNTFNGGGSWFGYKTLLVLWIASSFTDILQAYTFSKKTALLRKLVNLLRLKVVELHLYKNANHNETKLSVNSLNSYTNSISAVLEKLIEFIPQAFTQAFFLFTIISNIGWISLVPIGFVLLVENGRFSYSKRMPNKKPPKFSKDPQTLFKNMRTIKQYAWEPKLLKMANYDKEAEELPGYLDFILTFMKNCTSTVAVSATLYLYSARVQSITYAHMTMLEYQIHDLVSIINNLGLMSRYIKRSEETKNKIIHELDSHKAQYITRKQACQSNGSAIELNNCVFSWGEQIFQLQPLQLNIKHGEFVTIVGRIGSGKSSLLSAFCGEMPLISGSGCIYGSIGYVSQKPWIMNASFRDNVLFGNIYDKEKYNRIIAACALVNDIEQLPAKGATEIGPKGINLSGGQKARLALARAIYNDADIYILDDVLSAVDAQVERHLIEHILAGQGIISDKTRILVTHAEHVVPLSNRTFCLDNGKLSIISQDAIEFESADNLGNSNEISDNASDNLHNSNSENAADNGAFTIAPELDVPQFNYGMLWKYIRLCGFGLIVLMLAIEMSIAHLDFYSMLKQKDHRSTIKALQRYLILDLLAKVISELLSIIGYKLRVIICARRAKIKMRKLLAKRLAYTQLSKFERLSIHSILSIYDNDTHVLAFRLLFSLYKYMKIVSGSLYALYGLIRYSPATLLLSIPCLLALFWIKKHKPPHHIGNSPVGIDDFIGELINGHEMIRVHSKVDIFIDQLQNMLKQNEEYQAQMCNFNYPLFETRVYDIIKLGTIIYAKWLKVNCIQAVHPNDVKVWIDMCTKGIKSMCFAISDSRIKGLLPVLAKYFAYAESLEQEAPHYSEVSLPKLWPQHGRIAFKNLSMRYRDGLPMVLNEVSFSTNRYEKIGIVGRTGAGKSSLTMALLRLIEPASGCITIDGIDISTVGLYDLRSRISMVPQDPMLLEGTLRDNLDPAYEYTDKEILAAIDKSCIGNLIFKNDNVPEYKKGTGLDTWVEADGTNFSIGQRQLISLCRALLWNRTILILDEATANIDSESDKLIQSIIRKEFKNCTVLTIAHRLKTVMDSDRILVMDQGRIAEFDTPSNLIAQQGIFAELVASMKFNENNI